MTYQDALLIHWTPKIRSAGKLREAARTIFNRGLTADYPKIVALYDRAETIEARKAA